MVLDLKYQEIMDPNGSLIYLALTMLFHGKVTAKANDNACCI